MKEEKKINRFFFYNFSLFLGLVLLFLIFFLSVLSFFWIPYPLETVSIKERFFAPSLSHWCGTDHLGRDVFSMILVATRNSVGIAFLATLFAGFFGVLWGCIAAMKSDIIDESLMRLSDIMLSFPSILLAIMITALWGYKTENILIVLVLFNIPIFARIAHTQTISIRHNQFITAAYALGRSPRSVIFLHILPNIKAAMLAQGTSRFSICLLAEASLSYAGFGLQPPAPSLGRIVSETRTMMDQAPHAVFFPALTLILIILGANLLGEGLSEFLHRKK